MRLFLVLLESLARREIGSYWVKYISVVSGVSHLSKGRRELGRRFVPLANAAALFRKKPTHFSYFGGSSVSDAVQGAVSESKVNKDLVILPKRRPQPFRFSHPGGKSSGQDYYKTASRGGYSSQRQQTGKGKFQSQRGRNWRNKNTRGKGKRQQAKSSTQE